MRRSTLWMCALLAIATFGCDRIKQEIEKRRHRTPPAQTKPAPAQPALAATPGGAPGGQPVTPAGQPAPPPAPPQAAAPPRPRHDVAYVSEDTGTVAPGMSEKEVYSLWGPPAAVRRSGEYTYLFFRNGCEYSCGMLDLVTLQNGQVVDAVVRWPGHGYSGQSSSPPGGRQEAPPGGDTLKVPTPPTP